MTAISSGIGTSDMGVFKRYGLYLVPEGALFDAASAWLGWDSRAGQAVAHPDIADLPEPVEALTATPRKYGFHGTIKPPFALADGTEEAALDASARAFCRAQPAVSILELSVERLGGFVALVPTEPSEDLARLAGAAVAALDRFRAPPGAAELARRRASKLSPRQEAMLVQWGYPFVMEEFRFHMTLTGRTKAADPVCRALTRYFAPHLPRPFHIHALSLMGEDTSGRFHHIRSYPLLG